MFRGRTRERGNSTDGLEGLLNVLEAIKGLIDDIIHHSHISHHKHSISAKFKYSLNGLKDSLTGEQQRLERDRKVMRVVAQVKETMFMLDRLLREIHDLNRDTSFAFWTLITEVIAEINSCSDIISFYMKQKAFGRVVNARFINERFWELSRTFNQRCGAIGIFLEQQAVGSSRRRRCSISSLQKRALSPQMSNIKVVFELPAPTFPPRRSTVGVPRQRARSVAAQRMVPLPPVIQKADSARAILEREPGPFLFREPDSDSDVRRSRKTTTRPSTLHRTGSVPAIHKKWKKARQRADSVDKIQNMGDGSGLSDELTSSETEDSEEFYGPGLSYSDNDSSADSEESDSESSDDYMNYKGLADFFSLSSERIVSEPRKGGEMHSPRVRLRRISAEGKVIHNKRTEKILASAREAAQRPLPESKSEATLNKLDDQVHDHSTAPNNIKQFYQDNSEDIIAGAKDIADIATKNIDIEAIVIRISDFEQACRQVMVVLDGLASAHPFLQIAVSAFKVVANMEFQRRDNERKIVALKLEMLETMQVLTEIKGVEDPERVGPGGLTLEGRLQSLVIQIASDIEKCGNACDAYKKKNVVVRILKSSLYESKLAGYSATFAKHRDSIKYALSIHATIGIDSANASIGKLDTGLHTLDGKVDLLLAVFHGLDTPLERHLRERSGDRDLNDVADDDDTLQDMISIARNANHDIMGNLSIKTLKLELREQWEETLQHNLRSFKEALDSQLDGIQSTVKLQGQKILQEIQAGPHEQIQDPALRALWKNEGWTSYTEANKFMNVLYDYYYPRRTEGPNKSSPLKVSMQQALPEPPLSGDRWAYQYIHLEHAGPILEAFDEDWSGHITYKEVNSFTASQPEGWSLPHSLAYWAVGRHLVTWKYKCRAHTLISKMSERGDHVLHENRTFVNKYLDDPSYKRLQLLFESLTKCSIPLDPILEEKCSAYVQRQLYQMQNSLEQVDYVINVSLMQSSIVDGHRIEHHIFPLLYLLLRRHMKIIDRACTNLIDGDELLRAQTTLAFVVDAIEERVRELTKQFGWSKLNVDKEFRVYAFGMFRQIYSIKPSTTAYPSRFLGKPDDSVKDDDEESNLDLELDDSAYKTWEGVQALGVDGVVQPPPLVDANQGTNAYKTRYPLLCILFVSALSAFFYS